MHETSYALTKRPPGDHSPGNAQLVKVRGSYFIDSRSTRSGPFTLSPGQVEGIEGGLRFANGVARKTPLDPIIRTAVGMCIGIASGRQPPDIFVKRVATAPVFRAAAKDTTRWPDHVLAAMLRDENPEVSDVAMSVFMVRGRPWGEIMDIKRGRTTIPAPKPTVNRSQSTRTTIPAMSTPSPAAVTAERRRELLAMTAAGRAILAKEGSKASAPSPAKPAVKASAKPAGTISPARRRELLSKTPSGQAILRKEQRGA